MLLDNNLLLLVENLIYFQSNGMKQDRIYLEEWIEEFYGKETLLEIREEIKRNQND